MFEDIMKGALEQVAPLTISQGENSAHKTWNLYNVALEQSLANMWGLAATAQRATEES